MVSYQKWTSIVFDVAKSKGAQFEGISDGQPVVQLASEVWQERKADLNTATDAEARRIAQDEVQVR